MCAYKQTISGFGWPEAKLNLRVAGSGSKTVVKQDRERGLQKERVHGGRTDSWGVAVGSVWLLWLLSGVEVLGSAGDDFCGG